MLGESNKVPIGQIYWGRGDSMKTLVAVAILASSLLGQIAPSQTALGQTALSRTAKTGETPVSAVEGQSWIRHIRKSFNDTSMGKTWVLGPAPAAPGETAPVWQMKISPEYATQITSLRARISIA